MRRAWLVLGVVAATARHARADAPPDAPAPVHLVYQAPDGCPDQAAFEASVRERAAGAVLAADAPRTFTIAVTPTPDGFTGTLTTPDARTSHVDATRCDDLVLALAFMTALAIEPGGSAPPAPPPPTPPAPPPPPAPVDRGAPRWHVAAMIAPELDLGVTPRTLPAGSLEGRYARAGLGHADLGVVLGRDTASTKVGDARFTWLIARASACWTPLDHAFEVDACVHLEGGMLEAQGVDVIRAQDLRRSWFAAGVHAGARWNLGASIFAELRAGASVPFVRDRFYFVPNVFIHEAAAITPWVGLGVGYRFW
jgi:hypothetical protein